MINKYNISKYCSEDISKIENYEQAVNSKEMWDCHHRLEIQGDNILSRNELINQNLYYDRPSKELIFLTRSEHMILHNKNQTLETKIKMSETCKFRFAGKNNPMYGRRGKDSPNFGKKRSEESRKRMSEAQKGEKHPLFGKRGKDNPNFGRHHSEETKLKLREAWKRRKQNKE